MLIDEVDVFFSPEFFGEQYAYGCEIKSTTVEKLADFVWANRSNISYNTIVNSSEFKLCEE